MRFVRCLVVCAVIAGTCLAQLPEFYKRVNRVTWLVKALTTRCRAGSSSVFPISVSAATALSKGNTAARPYPLKRGALRAASAI